MTLGYAIGYVLLAYLVGAIPTGYLLARWLKGIDIREHGSGNVGGTNVSRVVGKKAGWATYLLDFFKGFLAVLVARLLFSPALDPHALVPVVATLAAIVGHSRSVFLGFAGGKSVVTTLGGMTALHPVVAVVSFLISVGVIKLTRYVSLGSLTGAVLLPTAMLLIRAPLSHILLFAFVCVYVFYLHRGNIQRLITHQENRI